MRIQFVSDLHLEFPASGGTLPLENVDGKTDLLVLAGDICIAGKAQEFAPFFKQCTTTFPRVIYIAGNHEFYHGDIEEVQEQLAQVVAPYPNVEYLSDKLIDLGPYWLFAGTLWTDCNGGNPLTKNALRGGMNDYRLIQWKSRQHWTLRPEDTIELHNHTLHALDRALTIASPAKPLIVVTHHAPSRQSLHPRYANDTHINGGYQSDLEYIMESNADRLPLWIHGHTHSSFDYTVAATRVVCNPRGYVTALVADAENRLFDPRKVIELP